MTDEVVTEPGISLTMPGFFLRPDYFEVLRHLRERDPVHRTDDGLLAVSRYEDIRAISRDPDRFVSGRGVLINDPLRDPAEPGATPGPSSISTRPCTQPIARLVNRQFTPRAVARPGEPHPSRGDRDPRDGAHRPGGRLRRRGGRTGPHHRHRRDVRCGRCRPCPVPAVVRRGDREHRHHRGGAGRRVRPRWRRS